MSGKVEYGVGDTVRLISEQKRMTVEKVEDGLIECVWISQDDELLSYRFKPAMLVVVRKAGE